jgi:hypothetical protein
VSFLSLAGRCPALKSFAPSGADMYFWNEKSTGIQNSKLNEFVVMPNHVYGIILLDYFIGRSNPGITVNLNRVVPHNLGLHLEVA